MFNKEVLKRSLHQICAKSSGSLFELLAEYHDEPHRHYHDRTHITECLTHFERFRELASQPHHIEVAFWFHDAIYDVRRNDNEEMSAGLAERELAAVGVANGDIRIVSEMIVATKSHASEDTDTLLLVDIDLGILGASGDAFEGYDDAIRKEYSWVPEE